MAVVGDKPVTMADWAKLLGPNNQYGQVIKLLNRNNPITEDAPLVECNNGTSHVTVLQMTLPEASWGRINRGTPVSKGSTKQIDEETGVLESVSEVDERLLDIAIDRNAFLLAQSQPHLERMKQAMAETLFYGNRSVDPAAFNGLGYRYWTTNPDKTPLAEQVVDMGGAGGNLTSVWLTVWGESTLHLIHPQGSQGGVACKVLENQRLTDADNNPYTGHSSFYKWYCGLALVDYRSVVRIANVDSANLAQLLNNGAGNPADSKLIRAMIQAVNVIPAEVMSSGTPVWYINGNVKTQMELMAVDKSNVCLSINEVDGQTVTKFRGIPVRQCDAIVNHEEQVAA